MTQKHNTKINLARNYNLISWNVNGYNDEIHAWMCEYIIQNQPDLIFLSETKRNEDILQKRFASISNYNYIINSHVPHQYHGVAMLIRNDISFTEMTVNIKTTTRRDTRDADPATGRVICVMIEDQFLVVGAYVPNSGVRNDPEKLDYRLNKWDPAFYRYLRACIKVKPTIYIGDINVAPREIDVSNPQIMKKYAGFRIGERESLSKFMKAKNRPNWIDVWRRDNPDTRAYTWFGKKFRPGYGMRLDNILVSDDLAERIQSRPFIDCKLSDHLPIACTIIK